MRPGVLRRRSPLRRGSGRLWGLRQTIRRERIPPWLRRHVYDRDGWRCIASRFDTSHRCVGALTLDHVPERGQNAEGKKAPTNRWHLVAACFGANDAMGWCNRNRESERAWLEAIYGPGPYPSHRETREQLDGAIVG